MKPKYQIVKFEDLHKGLIVYDPEGLKGIVKDCADIHNVVVKFKGGGGIYCFFDGCELYNIEPLYANLRKLKLLKIEKIMKKD